MNYRLLAQDEWGLVKPLVDQQGWKMPDNTNGIVAIAEDEKGIEGCLFAQVTVHVEPAIVKHGANGSVSFPELIGVIDRTIKERCPPGSGYYILAARPGWEWMIRHHGKEFKEVPGKIFFKTIGE